MMPWLLVSVSTGGVADKSANADKVYSMGIGLNANGNISVRGHIVEVKSALLFLRVNCVIKDKNEIKARTPQRSQMSLHSLCLSKPILCHRWWTVVIRLYHTEHLP